MSDDDPNLSDSRYEYTEFDLDDGTVVMLEDVENRRAWIQSTEVRKVRA